MSITPKKWESFQHYKDRAPSWIKLHRSLLDDYEFHCLPVASRALAPCLWLLASEYEGGEISLSPKAIAFRLRMSETDLMDALKPLVESGFFIDASGVLAGCYQDASLEKERETEIQDKEEERENAREGALVLPFSRFDEFWELYPSKVGKPKAEASYRKALRKADHSTIIDGLLAYRNKTDDRPWCNPTTWLNQERWADEFAEVKSGSNQRGQNFSNALDRLEQYADGPRASEVMRETGGDPVPLISDGRFR